MPDCGKKILFFNARIMPHSIRLHESLTEEGYLVDFWYHKGLTALYPWKNLDARHACRVYGRNGDNLKKLVREALGSDLVIITGWYTRIHVLLAVICFLSRTKYAYWMDVPETPGKGLNRLFKRVLLHMADYLLITGHEGIRRITEWYKIKSTKCRDFPYLSADVSDYEPTGINNPRIEKLCNGGRINVLITTRFEKRKGYRCLYDALKLLGQPVLDNFRFTIIGSGSEYEEQKRLFNGLNLDVEFRYWVEYPEYLKKMSETDILIHPSVFEPFGIPPIDAMAFGKLVIASDAVMSARDRITDGENGYIFGVNDPVRLSEILGCLSGNPSVIYRLGNLAAAVSKKYQPRYNIKRINEIMDIINPGRS